MSEIAQVQVNLFCADVDSCFRFYRELGFIEAFRVPRAGPAAHVEVEAAGVRIGLTAGQVANGLVNLGVAPGSPPSTEIVLWSADTDEMYERAIVAGASSIVKPMDSPDGRLYYAWVRDPDGHQVKFVQQR